jgi:hypothetical protein
MAASRLGTNSRVLVRSPYLVQRRHCALTTKFPHCRCVNDTYRMSALAIKVSVLDQSIRYAVNHGCVNL